MSVPGRPISSGSAACSAERLRLSGRSHPFPPPPAPPAALRKGSAFPSLVPFFAPFYFFISLSSGEAAPRRPLIDVSARRSCPDPRARARPPEASDSSSGLSLEIVAMKCGRRSLSKKSNYQVRSERRSLSAASGEAAQPAKLTQCAKGFTWNPPTTTPTRKPQWIWS
jgi:hypothetical protein